MIVHFNINRIYMLSFAFLPTAWKTRTHSQPLREIVKEKRLEGTGEYQERLDKNRKLSLHECPHNLSHLFL